MKRSMITVLAIVVRNISFAVRYVALGVVMLQPGQSFPNHRHIEACEIFYTLAGEVTLYLNGDPYTLSSGDVLHCDPGEAHFLVNRGEVPWKGVFVKSPYIPGDSHPVDPTTY